MFGRVSSKGRCVARLASDGAQEAPAEHPLVPTRDDLGFFRVVTVPGGTAWRYPVQSGSFHNSFSHRIGQQCWRCFLPQPLSFVHLAGTVMSREGRKTAVEAPAR